MLLEKGDLSAAKAILVPVQPVDIAEAIEGLPEGIPEREKTIRIKNLMGYWLLEQKADQETMVTQQLFLNPEGSLPAFVINSLLVKGPFKTFQDLRRNSKNYGR